MDLCGVKMGVVMDSQWNDVGRKAKKTGGVKMKAFLWFRKIFVFVFEGLITC